jgi:menaquinone-dependent protoporphyrinogen oxidase
MRRTSRDRRRKRVIAVTVLVAYASKHGATRQVAERIAATLAADGQPADARPAKHVTDLAGYDAFVIGGAVYYGHWLKPVTTFLCSQAATLADRPVWLFSSGPLGSERVDDQGRDQREVAMPQEFRDFGEAVRARGLHVFFGALDPDALTLPERVLRGLPAARRLLPEGDFRDWEDVDAWADEVARQLSGVGATP